MFKIKKVKFFRIMKCFTFSLCEISGLNDGIYDRYDLKND